MRYGSICSGIEAATMAWHPLGWSPAFFAEIEAFPSAVLAHHYPDVPNLGDMTTIDAAAWRDRIELLVGGTPCQAFSVAGKRESLADDRGNLTLKFVELVHGIDPRWVVWENVPGVLSTSDNAFGCFIAGLVGEGEPLVCGDGSWPDAGMVVGPRRSAAWRVLDAQYFGLAQRRRRVFVVSGRTGDRTNPGAVLFEPESVPRDTPPRREAGQRVAASLTRGADSGGKGGYAGRRQEDDYNVVGCLDAHMGMGGPDDNAAQAGHLVAGTLNASGKAAGSATQQDAEAGLLIAHTLRAKSNSAHDDTLETYVTHSLRADGFDASEDGTGRGTPLVPVAFGWNKSQSQTMRVDVVCDGLQASPTSNPAVAYNVHSANSCAMRGNGSARVAEPTDTARALDSADFTVQQGGTVALQPIPFDTTQITSASNYSRPSEGDPCHPLAAENNVLANMAVRRLTPRECERLQGFPDGYTLIPFRGKPAADGPRYRALGNSMAVPCMAWIGKRIGMVDSSPLPTPASNNPQPTMTQPSPIPTVPRLPSGCALSANTSPTSGAARAESDEGGTDASV